MTSVRETFGLACPKCACDGPLLVRAETCLRLLPYGTEPVGHREWFADSPCTCITCGHSGLVDDFDIEKGGRP